MCVYLIAWLAILATLTSFVSPQQNPTRPTNFDVENKVEQKKIHLRHERKPDLMAPLTTSTTFATPEAASTTSRMMTLTPDQFSSYMTGNL